MPSILPPTTLPFASRRAGRLRQFPLSPRIANYTPDEPGFAMSTDRAFIVNLAGPFNFRAARQPDREGRLISRPPVYGALVNPKQ